jgi:hypothetical protein
LVSDAEGKTRMNDLPVATPPSAPALSQAKHSKPVRAKVRPSADRTTRQVIEPIHVSHAEWVSALREALGTGSDHFVHSSLRSLMAATVLPGESVPTTNSLSAALAFVQGMAPENEARLR